MTRRRLKLSSLPPSIHCLARSRAGTKKKKSVPAEGEAEVEFLFLFRFSSFVSWFHGWWLMTHVHQTMKVRPEGWMLTRKPLAVEAMAAAANTRIQRGGH